VARLRFLGPEGSKFEGLDLVMVRPGKAKIRDLAELQRGTGLKMADLQDALGNNEALAMQAVVFLTLRNAGLMVSFDDAGDFGEDELDVVTEPGDVPMAADPTSARSGSTPGAEPVKASKGSPSKPPKSGSKTRSAAVS